MRLRREGKPVFEPPRVPADVAAQGPLVAALFRWLASIASACGHRLTSVSEAYADGSLLCRLVRQTCRTTPPLSCPYRTIL